MRLLRIEPDAVKPQRWCTDRDKRPNAALVGFEIVDLDSDAYFERAETNPAVTKAAYDTALCMAALWHFKLKRSKVYYFADSIYFNTVRGRRNAAFQILPTGEFLSYIVMDDGTFISEVWYGHEVEYVLHVYSQYLASDHLNITNLKRIYEE